MMRVKFPDKGGGLQLLGLLVAFPVRGQSGRLTLVTPDKSHLLMFTDLCNIFP